MRLGFLRISELASSICDLILNIIIGAPMNIQNPVKLFEKPQNLSLDLIDLEVESVWVFKTLAKTKPPQRRCLPLATVDKEIDEVRYILRDAFGTQDGLS